MKKIDPSIKVGVVGYQKPKSRDPVQSRWNELVLPEIIDVADFYILHDYYAKYGAVLTPSEMLNAVDTTYSHIRVVNEAIEKYTDKKANHLPIALTEFNTRSFAKMSNGDGVTNVSHCAGLFFSHALGEIIRQGYGMAMMWDIENGYKDGQDLIPIVQDFQKIIQQIPNHFAAWTCLSWLQLLLKNNEEALAAARQAVRLNQQDPQARMNLSLALLATNNKGVRDHIELIKKMSMMVPDVKSELKESVEDGLNRYPDWPELSKVKKWLEF